MTYEDWKKIEKQLYNFYKRQYQIVYTSLSDKYRFEEATQRDVMICLFEYNPQASGVVRVTCYLNPLSIQTYIVGASRSNISSIVLPFTAEELKFLDMLGFQLRPAYAYELKNRLEAELERKVSLPRIEDWIYEGKYNDD